jgi:hypothetical protein
MTRAALSIDRFESAYAAGPRMTLREAVDLVVELASDTSSLPGRPVA